MSRLFLSALILSLLGGAASAQSTPPAGATSAPVVGGTTPNPARPSKPPLISGSQNLDILRHRDPTGKPCLTVYGEARPHTVNPNLFDHIIMASNNCAQLIKMQVCYYQTQQCIPVEVPGRMRKEAVLGMMPSLKDFRYEFRERF